jgi:short-subunit dehydrogenase
MPCTRLDTFYGPSKNVLVVLTRNLAQEYRQCGVTFTVVCPGATDTEIIQRGNASTLSTMWPKVAMQSAMAVAEETWRAAKRGRTVVIPGWANKMAAAGVKLMPERAVTMVLGRVITKRLTTPFSKA